MLQCLSNCNCNRNLCWAFVIRRRKGNDFRFNLKTTTERYSWTNQPPGTVKISSRDVEKMLLIKERVVSESGNFKGYYQSFCTKASMLSNKHMTQELSFFSSLFTIFMYNWNPELVSSTIWHHQSINIQTNKEVSNN